MAESRLCPTDSVSTVTDFAVCVETQIFVIGILSINVVIQVTEDAIRRQVFGLAAAVAIGTGNRAVLSS